MHIISGSVITYSLLSHNSLQRACNEFIYTVFTRNKGSIPLGLLIVLGYSDFKFSYMHVVNIIGTLFVSLY